jgi:hypothetical protein
MRIRSGRTRSLIGGVAAIPVMILGLVMMSRFRRATPGPGTGMPIGLFMVLWTVVLLIGAGAAFYNAFSRRGVALYQIDVDAPATPSEQRDTQAANAFFCPRCGQPVGRSDAFCRHCGADLPEDRS